jgi:hypothetical protein
MKSTISGSSAILGTRGEIELSQGDAWGTSRDGCRGRIQPPIHVDRQALECLSPPIHSSITTVLKGYRSSPGPRTEWASVRSVAINRSSLDRAKGPRYGRRPMGVGVSRKRTVSGLAFLTSDLGG